MTPLLYLMACLMSPAPLIVLAESRVSDNLIGSGGWEYQSQSSSVKCARQSPQKGFLSMLTQSVRSGGISRRLSEN